MTEIGEKSSTEGRVHMSTRVEPELAGEIAKSAKRNRRSVSNEIAAALEAWVEASAQEEGVV